MQKWLHSWAEEGSSDEVDAASSARWKKAQKKARREARSLERKETAKELRAKGVKPASCPHSRSVLVGTCDHGAKRFIAAPCGARDCAYCGPIGRSEIAKRISDGVRRFWALGAQCAWLVLTFPEDVEKADAVRYLGNYVRWLRRQNPWMEYAATFEVTKRGRLHINLVVGPWFRIPQRELQAAWEKVLHAKMAIVNVRMVDDSAGGASSVAAETAKSLSGYLAKLEQSVSEDRRVSFSRGWPRVEHKAPEREGVVRWAPASSSEAEAFEVERKLGEWVQRQGEWCRAPHLPGSEDCNCFQFKAPQPRLRDNFPVGGP